MGGWVLGVVEGWVVIVVEICVVDVIGGTVGITIEVVLKGVV